MKRIIEISAHAQYRLNQREILITECEAVLNDPHVDMPGDTPTSRKLYGAVHGRRLVVFVAPIGDDEYRLLSAADRDQPD